MKKLPRIFVPSAGPGDWKALLADPELHWARGKSARALAHCWEDGDGFPTEIKAILSQAQELADLEPMLIFPEWKVPLPGGSTASQNDAWVLASGSIGLVSIAVEGKVDESFGPQIGKWKLNASPGKEQRLNYLTRRLGLADNLPDEIYYQLIHRTASAVIEARRFHAKAAVMLVHTFSPEDQWFSEFATFCALFGCTAEIGKLHRVEAEGGLHLYLGWAHGDERYLSA